MRVERPVAPLGSWAAAALLAGLCTLLLCGYGAWESFAGLDVGETCVLVDHQDFDLDWWAAHASDSLLPPYSSPCNRTYDRVPGWVDPAIAGSALVVAGCVGALLLLSAVEVVQRRRAGTAARAGLSRSAPGSRCRPAPTAGRRWWR